MSKPKMYCMVASFVLAATAFAQTPQEIVSRMEAGMAKHANEDVAMVMDLKMPIVGTVTSKIYKHGDNVRMEAEREGKQYSTWSDSETRWTFDREKNEIEITDKKSYNQYDRDGMALFGGITEGYDVTIDKETADAWHLLCKKSKSNPNKDAPKRMDLVVRKGNYYPKSLKVKMSMVTMTIRDIDYGDYGGQTLFNPGNFPTATIVDKRK